MIGWRAIIATTVMTLGLGQPGMADDYLSGASLYRDVARFASFGTHRFGSEGDRATADWIAGELRAAGFSVEFQPVTLGRQYHVERASVAVSDTTLEATPFWWPPQASFQARSRGSPMSPICRCGWRRGMRGIPSLPP